MSKKSNVQVVFQSLDDERIVSLQIQELTSGKELFDAAQSALGMSLNPKKYCIRVNRELLMRGSVRVPDQARMTITDYRWSGWDLETGTIP